LRSKGLGLAAISYDPPEVLAAFSKRNGITFPLLSDVGSATIARYGILNTVVEEALGPNAADPLVKEEFRRFASVGAPQPRLRGIPFPGTFMLDRQGRVTSRFFEDYYRERTTVANALLRLGQGSQPVQATKVSTMHLDLTAYPSDTSVALGNRFSIVLDVAPKRGMHVYAPGAPGYRVVTLNLTPQPFVRALPIVFPASEIYHFRPLDERVPVYQKPFRLVQEIVPEITPEAQAAFKGKDSLTLTGTFDYQACDDKICYNPVSTPLSWTVAIRPFVTPEPAR
jgi:peroxiredoxin